MIVRWKGGGLCVSVSIFFCAFVQLLKGIEGKKSEMKNYLASRLFCYFLSCILTFSSTFYKTHAAHNHHAAHLNVHMRNAITHLIIISSF